MNVILFLIIGIVIGYFLRGFSFKKVDNQRSLPKPLSEFFKKRSELELKNRIRTQAIKEKRTGSSAAVSISKGKKANTVVGNVQAANSSMQKLIERNRSRSADLKKKFREKSSEATTSFVSSKVSPKVTPITYKPLEQIEARMNEGYNHRKRAALKSPQIKPNEQLKVTNRNNAYTTRTQSQTKFKRQVNQVEFIIKCNDEIFSEVELELLNSYGTWLSKLTSGKTLPETDEQTKFVLECNAFRKLDIGEMSTFLTAHKELNVIQVVWLKYITRLKYEAMTNPVPEKTWNWGWQGRPIESGSSKFFI